VAAIVSCEEEHITSELGMSFSLPLEQGFGSLWVALPPPGLTLKRPYEEALNIYDKDR
jgi:hypothetical protein